jgi:uncharacterized protein YjbJ (UPF0337 family)
VNQDQIRGTIDEAVGSAKRKAGELTDNPKLQVEGVIQQVKGKVENAWGTVKETVIDALQDSELHIDTRQHHHVKTSPVDVDCRKDT